MRFQRSFKILPGLRLNLSKSGFGLSAGVRGLRVGTDAKGRSYMNAGIPGTGLSVRQYAKTGTVPRDASPALQPPEPHKISASAVCPPGAVAQSKVMGTKGVLALVGLGVVVVGAILSISQRGENSPAPPALTLEQEAIDTAVRELAHTHPEFTLAKITPDGPYPAKKTADGYEVRLSYLKEVGGFMPFVCQVRGMTAACAAPAPPPRPPMAALATPSPQKVPSKRFARSPAVAGSRTYVGPRGGVYHYSKSGKKVYERRRR